MKHLILTASLLALTVGAASAQDVVRMGTEGAYPPYNFIKTARSTASSATWVTSFAPAPA